MPCNLVVTNTVELKNVKDHDLLLKALVAEFGPAVRVNKSSDIVFTVDGRECTIGGGVVYSTHGRAALEGITGRVQQAYARESVFASARRFGWTVQKGASAYEFALVKQ